MPTKEEVAEKAAQREGLITRNWILGGSAGLLLLIAQGLIANIISNAAGEIKITNDKLGKVTSMVEIEAVRNETLRSRVTSLENDKKDDAALHRKMEERLNSLETRAAIHDQWHSQHNH